MPTVVSFRHAYQNSSDISQKLYLRNAALYVVRERQQQVLQVRQRVAHVQCAEIPLTHELT